MKSVALLDLYEDLLIAHCVPRECVKVTDQLLSSLNLRNHGTTKQFKDLVPVLFKAEVRAS